MSASVKQLLLVLTGVALMASGLGGGMALAITYAAGPPVNVRAYDGAAEAKFAAPISPTPSTPATVTAAMAPELPEAHPALVYARAMQQGDWDMVIARTRWMLERLAYVRRAAATPQAEAQALADLKAQLARFAPAGNHIAEEGIEDRYLLTPQAKLSFAGRDAGLKDLEQPCAERVWLLVQYPEAERAPRGPGNLPLRQVRVGFNLDADGYLLKAGVQGNLEIDWDSLQYYLPSR